MAAIAMTKNKWVRGVAYVVLGVLLLWLLSWLLVPPILKSEAQKIGAEKLGRAVTIGSVDFKPWSLELTVNDVVVAGAPGSVTPQLQVSKLYVNAEMQSIVRLAPVVIGVNIDGVHLNVTHLGDGKYDFDDIVARLNQGAQPADPSKGPARFALYNLSLTNSSVDYDDEPVKHKHEVRQLELIVPFLSSFDGQRGVDVEPRLTFVLNGSRFDSSANTTPFAQTRKTDATIKISGFDLQPYLGYIPASVPVKVQGALVDAALNVAFEQTPKTSVKLSGLVQVSKVKVADLAGQPLFSLDALKLPLDDVRPLEKVVKLGAIELTSPDVAIRRDAAGQLNVAGAGASAPETKSEREPGPVATPASGSATAAPPVDWAISVASVALRGGKASWSDASTGATPSLVSLNDIVVDASDIAVPFAKPLTFKATAALASGASASASAPSSGHLTVQGTATDKEASVKANLGDIDLALASPYLAAFIEPDLSGKLNADADVEWRSDAPLKAKVEQLTLDRLALVSSVAEDQPGARRVAATTTTTPTTTTTRGSQPTTRRASAATAAASSKATSANAQRGSSSAAAFAASASPAQASDTAGHTTVARIAQVKIADADIDMGANKATIGSVAITEPRTTVRRDADKRWMFERWLKPGPGASPEPAGATPIAHSASAPASAARAVAHAASAPASPGTWAVTVGDVALDGGAVGFLDSAGSQPVSIVTTDLKVRMSRIAPGSSTPSPLAVSAKISAGRTEGGSIDYKGSVALAPLAAEGQVELARIPVHALQPYFGDLLNVVLVRADASFKGKVSFASAEAGPTAKVSGDAQVDNFLVNSVASAASPSASAASGASAVPTDDSEPRRTGSIESTLTRRDQAAQGEELLSWKSLALRGTEVTLAPGKPTTVDVKQTSATDLYARLILNENARLNLEDVVKAPAAPASSPGAKTTTRSVRGTTTTASTTPPSASATTGTHQGGPAGSSATTPAPIIRFGPVNLANARILFSDHFVRPNYSASLTELNGSLSAFTSVANAGEPQLADLELRGRAEDTASLEITGKLNPLAKPLALDITGKVRDLELPPLTPYAVKYSGYGIERGKMSVDVHYQVQPNGALTAQNKLVLNQLSFGDKVAGSTASLPVKLAVALLADRNGVIDVDLPLSGSLNDPQFSIGAIIGKAILNLVVKAITAPFSLLANAFGGGGGADQYNTVDFRPGSVALDATARARLDKVADALQSRPALKLTVVGTSSVDAEREPYRRERLDELLQAEKRKQLGAKAAPAAAPSASGTASGAAGPGDSTAGVPPLMPPAPITAAEYPELIKAVYRSADIAKPRNMIGLAKDIEPAQMESLLLANISVSDESIRELAVGRGVAVRDYLASRKLPLDRLFLGAAKADQAAPSPSPAASEPGASTAASPAASAPSSESAPASAPAATVAAAASAATGAMAEAARPWKPSAELTLSPR